MDKRQLVLAAAAGLGSNALHHDWSYTTHDCSSTPSRPPKPKTKRKKRIKQRRKKSKG